MLKKFFILFSIYVLFLGSSVLADNVSELQNKIGDREKQIQELENEIRQYTQEANKINQQAKTLENNIKTLDLSYKKISANINLTGQNISKTELNINQLNLNIEETDFKLFKNREIIGGMIRNINEISELNPIFIILSGKNIRDMWTDLDGIKKLQSEIKRQSDELSKLKTEMENQTLSLQGERVQLSRLKVDLEGQKQAVEENRKEKATLLNQTKNQEQIYKSLIEEKEQEKARFEKELFEYESQLRIFIDPTGYPNPRPGIISWPLDDIYITQRFGRTVAAQRLYVSGSHNGVDFRASTGTKIKSILDGVVWATGNTDAYPGCYSFGKWVMVKHPNGLSSIYAHLSVISVTTGQQISTGETLGFSGNTGYSTGPHLHLGLYATQGVRIEKHVTSRGCKDVTMPLADVKAYLDPLAYLPSL